MSVGVWLLSWCIFTHCVMSLTHWYDRRRRRKLKLLLRNTGIGSSLMRPNLSGWVFWFPIALFVLNLQIYYLNGGLDINLFVQLRNPKEVTKEDYNEFYKATFNEYLEPLASSHFTTEVRIFLLSLVPSCSVWWIFIIIFVIMNSEFSWKLWLYNINFSLKKFDS